MLDIKFIRKNAETVKEACLKKNIKLDIDKLLELDEKKSRSNRSWRLSPPKRIKRQKRYRRQRTPRSGRGSLPPCRLWGRMKAIFPKSTVSWSSNSWK